MITANGKICIDRGNHTDNNIRLIHNGFDVVLTNKEVKEFVRELRLEIQSTIEKFDNIKYCQETRKNHCELYDLCTQCLLDAAYNYYVFEQEADDESN